MTACILCVEDEAILLRDLCEELEAAGYQVLAANTVDGALKHLETARPDLILCDVMLGDAAERDGYFIHHFLREQRTDLADTPFLFLTAQGHRDALLEAKRKGIDDYLIKPVDYDMLLASIEARLAQVERLREHAQGQHANLLTRLSSIFDQMPGCVLLCDARGKLLYATPMAQQVAHEERLWQVSSSGALTWPGLKSSSAERLAKCLCEMSNAGDRALFALERQMGTTAVAASVVCLDDGAEAGQQARLMAIFLSSAQSRFLPDVCTLREMFGLTPSEAKVALLLAQGKRSEDVATELGVSATTIAFHLRNLFSKTNVTRQSELVALILTTAWAIPGASALPVKQGSVG